MKFGRGTLAIWALGLSLASPTRASVWPSSHERVVHRLEHGEVVERRQAAARLLELPPNLASRLAGRALMDIDLEVRLFAARAAAQLAVVGAADKVVPWLQDRDARLRAAACALIEAVPTPRAQRALARVLNDSDATVRRAAASAMGSSGFEGGVAPLLGHLDDASDEVRLAVVRALGRIGDRRAVVPLASKLQDPSPPVRRQAARTLGEMDDLRAVASLMLALQDPRTDVRVQALQALGNLRAADALSAITATLAGSGAADDPSGGPIREAALAALGRIGTEASVTLLVRALEHEGPVEFGGYAPARAALLSAGSLAVASLVQALRSAPSKALASASVMALARLGARAALPEIVRATRRRLVPLETGIEAIGLLGEPGALGFVLEHIERGASQAAIRAASRLLEPAQRDGRAVDVVRARLSAADLSSGERVALLGLLGRTGAARAAPILIEAADAKRLHLRLAGVQALGVLGVASQAVDTALFEALESSDAPLRRAAAEALARVGKDAAAERLLGQMKRRGRASLLRGIALSGAMERSRAPSLVLKVRRAIAGASAQVRDALFEGLGRMSLPEAGRVLAELSTLSDGGDRRKVAESLAGHAPQRAALMRLIADVDATVRANAAWSLGKVGEAGALAPLERLLTDPDVAVAGNAAVALARVAKRAGQPAAAASALCRAVSARRAYLRVGALVGLRHLAAPCLSAKLRRTLSLAGAWRVREATARLMQELLQLQQLPRLSAAEAALTKRALRRCVVEERHARVAQACAGEDEADGQGTDGVSVYVVPSGKSEPLADAPFALVLADGSLRLGVADRRGALFENEAPSGPLQLAVPAAQVP